MITKRDFPSEVRMATRDDGSPVIAGHAAMFTEFYDIAPGTRAHFRERIMPGAFADVIQGEPEDTAALFNHDPNMLLGRYSAGTLRMSESADGLAYETDPPNARADVVESIERGDVKGNSFAFTIAEQEWNDEADVPERTITRIGALYDVGPVVYPANPATDVALRELRDAGFDVPDVDTSEQLPTFELVDGQTVTHYPARALAKARALELRTKTEGK